MRIGILTFQSTTNYGAVIQMYALYTYLSTLGYECEVINYENDLIKKAYSLKARDNCKSIKSTLKWLVTYCVIRKKKKSFTLFTDKYVKISIPTYSKENSFHNDYDTIIVGSDQVWNLKLTGRDFNYYLKEPNKELKRVSYSASFGNTSFDTEDKHMLKKLLTKFDYLSVREIDGADFIKNNLGINSVKLIADPTFLLSCDDYSIISESCKSPDKFIFLYIQGRTDYLIDFIDALRKKTGYTVISVDAANKKNHDFINYNSISPSQFLYLIANAEYVVTSSFHGVALSLNLHTEVFFDYNRKEGNYSSRIKNIVDIFHIENYEIKSEYISNIDLIDSIKNTINWDKVDHIHNQLRDEAGAFIRTAVESDHE